MEIKTTLTYLFLLYFALYVCVFFGKLINSWTFVLFCLDTNGGTTLLNHYSHVISCLLQHIINFIYKTSWVLKKKLNLDALTILFFYEEVHLLRLSGGLRFGHFGRILQAAATRNQHLLRIHKTSSFQTMLLREKKLWKVHKRVSS